MLTQSPVPAICLQDGVDVMLGIDEAGRGPVLGPMVYGAAYWRVEDDAVMSSHGFDDSKALTHESRQRLFDKIKGTTDMGYVTRTIDATEISHNMLTRSRNLNEMSRDAAIEMIDAVQRAGVNVTHVYVDTVGDPNWYRMFLTKHFHGKIVFVVEKKADSLFKVVSAASICAKVTRDAVVAAWKYETPGLQHLDTDFGSGYPSDPKCKRWLNDALDPVFGYPNIVRFSWGTLESYHDRLVDVTWPHDKEDAPVGTQSIAAFMTSGTKKRKRAAYFAQANFEIVQEL
ncbi:ribonuclease HII [Aphanomyces invadans]|uniref:Ribonuclease n=1 Tax=Aphanomyces invadans TaxID=157072 RepID=A0A024TYR8_9STRA|nr:ribonuclease HII [Aphanomyces invadans]ETV99163.1 ribonuclease HII [Aphanomyces invadans]|eukprot:XP_008872591.1 ribonuclease HII [Aphanomyces invadans]